MAVSANLTPTPTPTPTPTRIPKQVRDVAVSRLSPQTFAVGLENGMVQLFDMRNSKGPLQALQAHGAPVFCLDFHPG